MAIVTTEIVADIPGNPRVIYYRCQDSQGIWHEHGPVITTDPSFDADTHKSAVAVTVAESLAKHEYLKFLEI